MFNRDESVDPCVNHQTIDCCNRCLLFSNSKEIPSWRTFLDVTNVMNSQVPASRNISNITTPISLNRSWLYMVKCVIGKGRKNPIFVVGFAFESGKQFNWTTEDRPTQSKNRSRESTQSWSHYFALSLLLV